MHFSSRVYRKFLVLVLGTLVISAVAAGPALAGGHRQSTGSATCSVVPNPVTSGSGQRYDVVGSGFQPGVQLAVFVGGNNILMAVTDSAGSFDTWEWERWPAGTTGTASVYVYRAGDRHMTVLAQCSFELI